MSTDEQPNHPTRRRAGSIRRLRRACPTFQHPALVCLDGGLSLTDQAWADLQRVVPDPGVDAEASVEQLGILARFADALAAQADQALTTISGAYDRQRQLLRSSQQRRAAALASLCEAATSATPVAAEEMTALVAAAQSENDADYAAARSGLRTMGHNQVATLKVLAAQLAAFVDHLDELAAAHRHQGQPNGPHGDQEPS